MCEQILPSVSAHVECCMSGAIWQHISDTKCDPCVGGSPSPVCLRGPIGTEQLGVSEPCALTWVRQRAGEAHGSVCCQV